jgi:phytoene dehydrogenase-like protein
MVRLEIPKSDAIIVGSGPNGLAAAIRLARRGWQVTVLEQAATPGGGVRSAELTLPGFVHDFCSSVYPMGVCSPFMRSLPLREHGVEWVIPPTALAHPFEDGTAAVLHNSLGETVAALGEDGGAYQSVVGDLVPRWPAFFQDALAVPRFPRHPILMAGFARRALRSGSSLAKSAFKTERARGLFAGLAAHSMLPLDKPATAAVAISLAVAAHAAGWPMAKGGAQQLTNGLTAYLKSLDGRLMTNCRVDSLEQLPPVRAVLLDVTPRQLLQIAGDRLPTGYRRKLERYRYGMAAFKVDWALAGPAPWRAPQCRNAGTLHLGATLQEICESESRAANGGIADRPFVLFAQPSVFDSSRAPVGKHTAWGYCHVPHAFAGDAQDVVKKIEQQVERFAPGFRDLILARSVLTPVELEAHNPNLIGGDIGGGSPELGQLFLRPTASRHRTPLPGVYLCSSSTPPGPGVHGMCGYYAAEAALKDAARQ